MKKINLNRFLMLLMLSVVSSAQAGRPVIYENADYPTIERVYTVTETDSFTSKDGNSMSLSEKLDELDQELKYLERVKTPCPKALNRSELEIQIDLIEREMRDLPVIEQDQRLYDQHLRKLKTQLKNTRASLKKYNSNHKQKQVA